MLFLSKFQVIFMKKSITKNSLTVLFAAAYMISYLTRINFGAVISEMVRISQIGEGSAEQIELTVSEISSLKYNLADILNEDSLPEAVRTLNLLESYLEVRASRLSFKGYPEVDQSDDGNGDGEPDDGETDENPGGSGNGSKSIFDIIASIINEIINWFKNLFK